MSNQGVPEMTLVVGQWWYVRIRDASCLTTVTITELTPLTVEIRGSWPDRGGRYKRSEIEFVELTT